LGFRAARLLRLTEKSAAILTKIRSYINAPFSAMLSNLSHNNARIRHELNAKHMGETAMAVIDFDTVVDMEGDAKAGKPQALYQLGLCYSTGQGVELDLVRAHKFFNLAAMKGVAEARLWRAELAQQMSSNDIAEAQRLARLWLQETAH
jgi:hypothetical protein